MNDIGTRILHSDIQRTGRTERRLPPGSGILFTGPILAICLWTEVVLILCARAGLMGWGQAFLYSGAPLLTIGLTWAFVQWRTR